MENYEIFVIKCSYKSKNDLVLAINKIKRDIKWIQATFFSISRNVLQSNIYLILFCN